MVIVFLSHNHLLKAQSLFIDQMRVPCEGLDQDPATDYLKQMFKTSDTFFPGYEGIVMVMKDHANYQIVKNRIDEGCPDCRY